MSLASVTSPTELKCSRNRSSVRCLGRFLIINLDLRVFGKKRKKIVEQGKSGYSN